MGSGQIPASSISFANTFGVLITVVFYDLVVVPLTNKIGKPITMTMRIGIGFVVQMIALMSGEGAAGLPNGRKDGVVPAPCCYWARRFTHCHSQLTACCRSQGRYNHLLFGG